jgi:hypothetical protein
MEKLEFPNDPEEWGLFIEASKLKMKAALLHNAKVKPSNIVVHSVAMNEIYDNLTNCNQLQGPLLAKMWGSYGDWTFTETSNGIEEVSVLFVCAFWAAEQQKTLYCKGPAS